MSWTERSKAAWNASSKEWEDKADIWNGGPRKEMLDFFIRFVPSGSKVLDLGCGPGFSTLVLQAAGYDAAGTDQSEAMTAAARSRGVPAYISHSDPLPFPDGSFDAVFACTSLEWTDAPARIIEEVRRVLKPNGRFVPVTLGPLAPPRRTAYRRLYGESVIHNMMMPWELKGLLRDHGFRIADMAGAYAGRYAPKRELVEQLQDNWLARAALSYLWSFACFKEESTPEQKEMDE